MREFTPNFKISSIASGTLARPPSASNDDSRSDRRLQPGPAATGGHHLHPSSSKASLASRYTNKMTAITDSDRSRSRRERTFIGSECAACEEPLEHTLRGERVLQFSCGHVSHEACFYEYIREADSQYCPTCEAPLGLDTTRGGSILDIGKFRRQRFVEQMLTWNKASSPTWFAPLPMTH